MRYKMSGVRKGLALSICILVSPLAAAGDDPCNPGRQAALMGDAHSAIVRWEELSTDSTAKERLRVVMTCLRNSGIASANEDAAKWIIDAASKSDGRSLLYAGMLYASGAGVPKDLKKAREYLERARDLHIAEAKEALQILDKASQKPN